ncbi:hypothetical protein HGRIS_008161 [Hohenbuehelia grisea]|uniref:Proteophosphoglycan ppg4 n=1 Tax=Hohenbuehelia grisea TaxID=104357 RepID=A0ABR3J7M9_9AGAR
MPKDTRPSLPTSSSDFALPSSSSSSSTNALDDIPPLLQRFRRPSLLSSKAGFFSETRLNSPLATSFTLNSSRKRFSLMGEESESDKDRMCTDSSPSSSETNTPPLGPPEVPESDQQCKPKRTRRPLTPTRRMSTSMDATDSVRMHSRRPSLSLKQPRVLNLRAESRPQDDEVQSEAAFQRLLSSYSELPTNPRTPRNILDRGRYPEEAISDDHRGNETLSDDDDDDDAEDTTTTFSFFPPPSTDPISIIKPRTPAGSVNGDDLSMSGSPGAAMDVDAPMASPSFPATQWRYTPPPTSSAVRSNKRKFSVDDRFDPYPTAAKRRAVSPSVSYLRESHGMSSPLSARPPSRLPIAIPMSIPGSAVSSAASSPTFAGNFSTPFHRPSLSIASSPTLRASMVLASPILRPIPRHRRLDGEDKEIEGAGEGVGGLTLAS